MRSHLSWARFRSHLRQRGFLLVALSLAAPTANAVTSPTQSPSAQAGANAFSSAFGQPAFGQPAFGQPAFGQPAFGQPAFGRTTVAQSGPAAASTPAVGREATSGRGPKAIGLPRLPAFAQRALPAAGFVEGDAVFVEARQLPATFNATGSDATILDVRSAAAFAAGHLPFAQSMAWEETRAGIFERGSFIGGKLPTDLGALITLFVEHGVALDRPVLVCGDPQSGWGEEGRVAWTLQYLGHPRVFILDGGCAGSSLATETVQRRVKGRAWKARVNEDIRAQQADVLAAVRALRAGNTLGPQILDVRTPEEYEGATPYFEARGGHVAGAIHLHYKRLLDDKGRLKSKDALRSALQDAGIDLDRPVIAYCTGGVRSAWAALALQSADVAAANYDGSMWEWAANRRLPMEDTPRAAPAHTGGKKINAPSARP